MPNPSFYSKILAQSRPAAGVLTDIYVVPVGKNTVVSSLMVTNSSQNGDEFFVSVAPSGAPDDLKQYLYFDEEAQPTKSRPLTDILLSLHPTDVIRVKSTGGFITFNVFGMETS